jgi:flagellar protein FlgJ
MAAALPALDTGVGAVRHGGPPVLAHTDSVAEARKAGEGFEAFFLTQMLEYMFEGVPTDGPFGGGFGEGVYRSFMLQEYGKVLAKAGGIGLGDTVTREILKMQEVS